VSLAGRLLDRVRRAVLGLSPEEVRYTFEDVRAEIRAVRTELKGEIAALRQAQGEREEAAHPAPARGEPVEPRA
jgi:uncharacterized protein (DUF3084 family)